MLVRIKLRTTGKLSDLNRFIHSREDTQSPVICVYVDPAYDNPTPNYHLVWTVRANDPGGRRLPLNFPPSSRHATVHALGIKGERFTVAQFRTASERDAFKSPNLTTPSDSLMRQQAGSGSQTQVHYYVHDHQILCSQSSNCPRRTCLIP